METKPTRKELEDRLAAAERRIETLAAVCAAREAQIQDLRQRLAAYGDAAGKCYGSIRWMRECLTD